METGITNIDAWLMSTIRSDKEGDLINLDTGYEAATNSLVKSSHLIIKEIEKECLFNKILFLINETRSFVNESELTKKNERSSLLDDFEIKLRNDLSFDRSSYKRQLEWNGEHDLLYELFVHLKTNTNSKGDSYLQNSYEDIAVFLKSNFSTFKNTELSTIQSRIRKLSGMVARSAGKIKIEFKN